MGIFQGKVIIVSSSYTWHTSWYLIVCYVCLYAMYEIGGNVKNCVILSKNALMTKLVTAGTRTILVQSTQLCLLVLQSWKMAKVKFSIEPISCFIISCFLYWDENLFLLRHRHMIYRWKAFFFNWVIISKEHGSRNEVF